jgi:nicotinamide-nucleotide amidase
MPLAGSPVSALVAVGNELLYGETVDTNSAWLGRALAALGIPVRRRSTVGDVTEEIQSAVRSALEGADLVLVCGGLGPTPDDITKQAVAELLGLALRLDETLMRRLEERFRARGYAKLPAANRSQAEVPEGAAVLRNPRGTAPGLLVEVGDSALALLPGVPRELRAIFEGDLLTAIERRFEGRLEPVRHRTIHTTGVAESRLSELIEPALAQDMGPVTVAFLPDLRGVDLRLSARGVAQDDAGTWFDRVEKRLDPLLGRWRFHASSGDVAEALGDALVRAGKRVAVAESCTGGLVAERITARAGASRVFVGGVVAYADAVKVGALGVSAQDIRREGAVSETVARQMALGVAERFGAEAGIGVTGIAGPGGGTPEKPVGTVWLAVSLEGDVRVTRLSLLGDRREIRERAAQEALARLLRLVADA